MSNLAHRDPVYLGLDTFNKDDHFESNAQVINHAVATTTAGTTND